MWDRLPRYWTLSAMNPDPKRYRMVQLPVQLEDGTSTCPVYMRLSDGKHVVFEHDIARPTTNNADPGDEHREYPES